MKTSWFLVKGRVQGVSFRYYTQKKAIELGITGTVKNLFNGDVEIFAQGGVEDLFLFEKFINIGPPLAKVLSIEKAIKTLNNQYHLFEIIY